LVKTVGFVIKLDQLKVTISYGNHNFWCFLLKEINFPSFNYRRTSLQHYFWGMMKNNFEEKSTL